jgi:hypothetical protein
MVVWRGVTLSRTQKIPIAPTISSSFTSRHRSLLALKAGSGDEKLPKVSSRGNTAGRSSSRRQISPRMVSLARAIHLSSFAGLENAQNLMPKVALSNFEVAVAKGHSCSQLWGLGQEQDQCFPAHRCVECSLSRTGCYRPSQAPSCIALCAKVICSGANSLAQEPACVQGTKQMPLIVP